MQCENEKEAYEYDWVFIADILLVPMDNSSAVIIVIFQFLIIW